MPSTPPNVRQDPDRRGRRTVAAAATATAVLVLALFAAPRAGADEQSVAVFSEAQVEAGAAIYTQNCAVCHGTAFEGMGSFPVLAGAVFQERWEGRPLGDLYAFVSTNMPLGAGGSLEPDAYAAVVARLLDRNGVEPGPDAFDPTDEAALGVVLTFGD
ncbi:MAG: cytochrome c [Trueperaceae bacterium]|nr:cytochrome c [Trueperaceae bacterium]